MELSDKYARLRAHGVEPAKTYNIPIKTYDITTLEYVRKYAEIILLNPIGYCRANWAKQT